MTTTPRQSALRLIISLLLSTLLFSCGGGNTAQEGNGAGIAFRLKWPVAKSVGSAAPGVVTVRMSVSGPDMATISKDFPASDGAGSIANVPAGSSRTITFQGLASNSDLIYQAAVPNVALVSGVIFNCPTVTMNPVNASSTPAVPAVPSGLSATAVSTSQINLVWVDNANNETGYKIERKEGANGTYIQIHTAAANDTIYNDTALSASTTYYYRVRATNGIGDSEYGNEATATTSVVAPASTYSISGTITGGGAALAGVSVTRSGNGTTTTTTGVNGSYSFSGVQNGSYTLTPAKTGYTFIPATLPATLDGANLSAQDFVATAVTTVPAIPAGLSATAASISQINLAWTDTNNETGYKIERKDGASGIYAQIATVAANVTTYNDTASLSAATTYYYRIRATNVNGDSGYGNEANATTPAITYSISGTITNGGSALAGVTVTMTGNGSTAVATNGSGNYSFFGALDGSYTLTPALAGYTFIPSSLPVTVNGASLTALNFTATAIPVIPADPSGLSATAVSSNLINLAWVDNAINETGYKIERKDGASGTYAQIATVAATTTTSYTYRDTPLSASTVYYYRVRATNSIGDSGYSNETNATTYNPATLIVPKLVDVPAGISTYNAVTVGAFRIGKNEVTQGEWLAVMGNNPSLFSACGLDCPVENVSWNDVQTFIATLNGMSSIIYRLPTEAEWQYAAQSGGNGEVYSGGSDVNAVAWYSVNSGGITHPVGSIKPGSILSGSNGLGIYDMSGNVAEWVNDFYGTTSNHVIRGGSAFVGATLVTTTNRGSSAPGFRDKFLGFRLAAPPL
jgi:transcriptional regulator CtsR